MQEKIARKKIVGIVVPIYNVEMYLRDCLSSIVNQTYKNIKVILIDDGSTDKDSLNIAKEYACNDPRIIVMSKENGGQSSARNVGIDYFSNVYSFIRNGGGQR